MSYQEEIRKRVNEQILTALQKGVAPWRKPWCDLENTGFPANVVSKRPYTGINPLLLELAAMERGFTSKWWATFNQWSALGCHVQRRPLDVAPGQWGTRIVFCKPITKVTISNDGEEEEDKFFVLREYTVFNADQVNGAEEHRAKPRIGIGFADFRPAEEVLTSTQADIRYGGNRAFYQSGEDFIQLPPRDTFLGLQEFYGTALHELVHWTGHETRLSRLNKDSRFGNASYAFEELVAEIGGCYLVTELDLPQSNDLSNHHAYLHNWLEVLQSDHRAIFRASTLASKAADFILSFSRKMDSTSRENVEATVGGAA